MEIHVSFDENKNPRFVELKASFQKHATLQIDGRIVVNTDHYAVPNNEQNKYALYGVLFPKLLKSQNVDLFAEYTWDNKSMPREQIQEHVIEALSAQAAKYALALELIKQAGIVDAFVSTENILQGMSYEYS
jgi:hypothetical protein